MFREPLVATVGDIVERDGFCFADLVPDSATTAAQVDGGA
jgi:hypothetical protein